MTTPNFRPIQTERIYQKIVEQIRAMLTDGQIGPGDRLPSEREIAEQMGVSRAAVREAFSALEMTGLIEVRPGEGSFVKSGDILTPFALLQAMAVDEALAAEMFEIRRSLEGEAAWLAAQRRTEEDLRSIRYWLEQMGQDLSHYSHGEVADWEFHLAVAAASHNGLLLRVMHQLSEAMRRTVSTARRRLWSIPGMPQQLLQEHVAVYAAIEAQDRSEARKRMAAHVGAAQANSGL